MKTTLAWLKDHLDTEADLGQIVAALTNLGLEVESVEDRAAALAPFVVGAVVSATRHPNADKLQVCIVDTGSGLVQVICGAPNARAGMKGVFAPAGTRIPGTGLDLQRGIIRGVESNGMLCSEREMGLSDEHEGIIELPADAEVGTPFTRLMGIGDPLIDVKLTPDRGDCAGVRGIARDLAAAGLGALKPLAADPVPGLFDSALTVSLDFPPEAAGACPLFVGRMIGGVRNGASPRWLQEKLKSVGLRPISALVDITNFFTLDRNRPLHVFDADTVAGSLVVRLSRPGESLAALNDRTYALGEGMCVIADDDGVVSLGGVIGGSSTGVTRQTVNVFVEAALFDPLRTAATGRRLGIESDARYRFERGIDPDAVFAGMEQATRMILDICGGEPSRITVAGAVPNWRRTIALRATRVERLGGVPVPLAEQMRILAALGFAVAEDVRGLVQAAVPSWRSDVQGEADLVEEVLRVHGFDAIPEVPLPRLTAVTKPAVTPAQKAAGLARRALAARGLDEVVTWSFMKAGAARHFGFADEGLRLVNPINAELDVMRPSILPNLLEAAGRNAARGLPDAALFEVGPAYRSALPEGQDLVAAGVRTGAGGPRHWAAPPRPVDAFDARADAEAALEAAGAPVDKLQVSADAPGWYHPGRSGCLRLGPTVLARFGELHPAVLAALDVAAPAVGFEVILSAVPRQRRKAGSARPPLALSPLQPVTRDFAFVVDEAVPAERLVRAVRAADRALVADVGVFDVWRGPALGPGRKSIALWVTIQPAAATMTEAELEGLAKKIIAQAERQAGAVLRT